MRRTAYTRLEELPYVGPAIAAKLRRIDIQAPSDLMRRDPYALFNELQARAGQRHDPCLLDVFISVVRIMHGEPVEPWWTYTAERKSMLAVMRQGRSRVAAETQPRRAKEKVMGKKRNREGGRRI